MKKLDVKELRTVDAGGLRILDGPTEYGFSFSLLSFGLTFIYNPEHHDIEIVKSSALGTRRFEFDFDTLDYETGTYRVTLLGILKGLLSK